MKHRLVVAALLAQDVVARARAEFDALVHEGDDDMTPDEVIAAARRHEAEAIVFTNTLPLSAGMIAQLPPSVRVGATSSVGYDHIDVAAAKAAGSGGFKHAWRADRLHGGFHHDAVAGCGAACVRIRPDHA